MKKQLLFVLLVGLLCFTSCNKSRELTPVDDKTGLQRAAAILEKEIKVMSEAGTNREKVFDILPKKFSFKFKNVMNGKTRKLDRNTNFLVEKSYNNYVVADMNCEINYETLQFHTSMLSDSDAASGGMEMNVFYDGTNYYYLTLIMGEKTKITTPANLEEAKAMFLEQVFSYEFVSLILPTSYLVKITEINQETQKYRLLETYDYVQSEYLKYYGNDDEHFNYQFGSDDESSFSLKNDLKVALHHGTNTSFDEFDNDAVYNGYSTGTHSATYNEYIEDLNDAYQMDILSAAPDLVVFKNNYLNYATTTTKIDIDSLPQSCYEAGAFYEHYTNNATLEVKEGASITNPNPNEYTEQQLVSIK